MSRLACVWLPALLLSMPSTGFAQSLDPCPAQGQAASRDGACALAPATGRTLRKCISRSGAVSIQNDTCAAGSRTAWVRATAPEPLNATRRPPLPEHARKRESDLRDVSRLTNSNGKQRKDRHARPGGIGARAKACETARRHRDEVLKSVGLRRDFDLLRSLNDHVYEACQ